MEGTLARYRPHVEEAARQGARVIVLPEASFDSRERGVGGALVRGGRGLGRALDVAIVAPFFDAATPRNTLAVIDESGAGRGTPRQAASRPRCRAPLLSAQDGSGPSPAGRWTALSTAICVDLDYSDTARSARRTGALLAVPANDWFGGFEVLHHKSAVWAGSWRRSHRALDRARHLLDLRRRRPRAEQQNSADGPVVLVADVRG